MKLCWFWQGPAELGTYGYLMVDGKKVRAHRRSYQLFYGEIPKGVHIHHICNNKMCINPWHLQAVTPKQHGNIHNRKKTVRKKKAVEISAFLKAVEIL